GPRPQGVVDGAGAAHRGGARRGGAGSAVEDRRAPPAHRGGGDARGAPRAKPAQRGARPGGGPPRLRRDVEARPADDPEVAELLHRVIKRETDPASAARELLERGAGG